MSILVVGGAGYIGAHVVRLLQEAGEDVVVVDDLSTSSAGRVGDSPLVVLDVAAEGSSAALEQVMRDHAVDAVIHFAARKQVGESVARPLWYYQQNVGGMVNVLSAMESAGVRKMIFSSSAAVYGMPPVEVVHEDTAKNPINPYGRTKLIGEWMLEDCGRAWDLKWVALRYFNVAGSGWADLGDAAIMNLIPMVFDRLARGEAPRVFGDDYPTPDGTCIRDYVHVLDLAKAHIAALRALESEPAHTIYNVGTGTGASVMDVVHTVGAVTGLDVTPSVEERRAGDPPQLIASPDRIAEDLGFRSTTGLQEIVESAWEAWNYTE